jgi:hypothetical protein
MVPEDISDVENRLRKKFLDAMKAVNDSPNVELEVDTTLHPRLEKHQKLFAEWTEGEYGGGLAGRYVIPCEEIRDQWPDNCDWGFSLKIVHYDTEFVGDFDFGILDGIMKFEGDVEELEM